MKKASRKKDIAIVGMSGRFPKSKDLQEFWQNLVEGKELVHFYTSEEQQAFALDEIQKRHDNFIASDAFIDRSDSFDYSFFGYTQAEAEIMDPQIRILHEQVWLALEDAACDPSTYQGKIGLYLSASDNLNWRAHEMMNPSEEVAPFLAARLAEKNFISTLISYRLNLRGPSFFIDTACSSSLVAVHLACRNLLLKECSLAIAGGVSINTTTHRGYFHEPGMITSTDGHCRAFDAHSTGTVWGEGAGVVVLKRLEEAIEQGDPIHAVIRATAVNNDGKTKVGYTAPSVEGQANCIQMTHKIAGIAPHTVSYIEAHGTGTKIGDPIEIEALNKAFANDLNHNCAIGSVKSNMGHLDTAAGIAGLIKTTLALKNRVLPPSLHFDQANPDINFSEGPFYVNAKAVEWLTDGNQVLRAGVSSFGIGGTNAHALLEEAPAITKTTISRPFELIPFSAKTPTALQAYREKIENHLQEKTLKHWAHLAHLANTFMQGRQAMKYRQCLIVPRWSETTTLLTNIQSTEVASAQMHPRVVFVFSGQGSQYYAMGRAIYEEEPFFKNLMNQGLEHLETLTGEDYKAILGYDASQEVDPQIINQTQYTQPLLFLIEYALARLLMHYGIEPQQMIGHSLGEYTAACISGVFSFETGLQLLVKRGALMSEVDSGDMLGIGASSDLIQPLLNGSLSIAAINTENACVVSGTPKAIKALSRVLDEKEFSFANLKTSHAFHSPMMDRILTAYEAELDQVNLSLPQRPFISNLTGEEVLAAEVSQAKYWLRHLRETVFFEKGAQAILKTGPAICIEVGPGKTLSNFIRQNRLFNANHSAINLLRHPKETSHDWAHWIKAIGQLWSQGLALHWPHLMGTGQRVKVPAPTYPFDQTSLPTKVSPFEQLAAKGFRGEGAVKLTEDAFYVSNWKRALQPIPIQADPSPTAYLILTNGSVLLKALSERLQKEGQVVVEVARGSHFKQLTEHLYTLDANSETDFQTLFDALAAYEMPFTQIIIGWHFEGMKQKDILHNSLSLLYFCAHVSRHHPGVNKKITFLGAQQQAVLGHEQPDVALLTLKTIANTFTQEQANIFNRSIDLEIEVGVEMVKPIIRELQSDEKAVNVAYRNQQRWIEFYESVPAKHLTSGSPIQEDGVYVVTGGLGYLGNVISQHLCDQYGVKLMIIERNLPHQPGQENGASPTKGPRRMREKRERMQMHHQKRHSVFYYQADVSDLEAMTAVIQQIEMDHGQIAGLIHAAREEESQLLRLQEGIDVDLIDRQFAAKIQGSIHLQQIFQDRLPDFVWIPLHLSSLLGRLENGVKAVADNFVRAWQAHHHKSLEYWHCVYLDDLTEGALEEQQLIQLFEQSLCLEESNSSMVCFRSLAEVILERQQKAKRNINEEKVLLDRPALGANYQAPENEWEQKLCELWQSFLGIQQIGVRDDFFELGGDSLKAMSLLKRLQKSFDIEISMQDFFEKSTIRSLAKEMAIAQKLKDIQQVEKKNNFIKI